MTQINIEIIYYETTKPSYVLFVDKQRCIEVKKGNLDEVVKEVKKYLRLRFKESLK